MTRRRILVPIDLCSQSDSALDFAKHIAIRYNAMISCLYVIEEQRFLETKYAGNEARLRIRRDAENKLSEKVNSILGKEGNTAFEIIVTSGKAHEKILEKSFDLNAQTIIMARSSSKELRKQKIGSNTKNIIAKAQVPVILINSNTISERKHIILPLDLFRPISKQAKCAIETAKLLNASVTVISVIEHEKSSLRPVYLKRLKEIRQLFKDISIDCNAHLLEKRTTIAAEILSFSGKIESGMILIMDNQEKSIISTHKGSIAREVIAKSELPVQCINPNYNSRFSIDDSNQLNKPNSLPWFSLKDNLINNQQETLL